MFLGVDLGTGSVKALLLAEDGHVLNEASRAYSVDSKHLGWAETDPELWWQATLQAVRQCCAGQRVSAISFSGQMHGTVLTDKQGHALRPAILWADSRAKDALKRYQQLSTKDRETLANPVVTGMMGVTLGWLKQNEADLYEQASFAVQPKDWLRSKLTNTLSTDPSDASATLLYDFKKDTWAYDIVEKLELRTELLAAIQGSSSVAGHLTKAAAAELGLAEGIPVVTGGADAACSAFGSGLSKEGQVQVNIGTAMQIFAIRETLVIDETLRTHLYRTVEHSYYAMAAMQNAGLAFEWVRHLLGMTWQDMYQEAFAVASGSEGLLFLPYLTGERTPHLNPNAMGTWHGLTLKHSRGHLARSAFEGIAFALRDGLAALEQTGIQAASLRLAGGGTENAAWQQLLANILNKPLYRVDVPSASAKGAALLAANATGKLQEQADVTNQEKQQSVMPEADEKLERAYQAFRQLYVDIYSS